MNRLFGVIDALDEFVLTESDNENKIYGLKCEVEFEGIGEPDIKILFVKADADWKPIGLFNKCLKGHTFVENGHVGTYVKVLDSYEAFGAETCDIDMTNGKEIEVKANVLKEEDELNIDLGNGKHVYINADGDEMPYIGGYSDDDLDVADRYDLSDDELWTTGWTASIQNGDQAPFSSFDDIKLAVFDIEKGNKYDMPCELPDTFKNTFVNEVNKYIENN